MSFFSPSLSSVVKRFNIKIQELRDFIEEKKREEVCLRAEIQRKDFALEKAMMEQHKAMVLLKDLEVAVKPYLTINGTISKTK